MKKRTFNSKKCIHIFPKLVFALCLLVFIDCGEDKTYTIEKRNGVDIIHNISPKDKNMVISLKLIQEYSKPESDDENYLMSRPLDLVKDSKNCVYILDNQENHIKKFDENGNYMLTIGRSGQGPGEFTYVATLGIDDKDRIFVHQMEGRLQVFDSEGHYQSEYRLPMFVYRYLILDSNHILINKLMTEEEEEEKENNCLLHIINYSGNIISSFCERKEYSDPRGLRRLNGIGFCKDKVNNIFVSFRSLNRIEKYNTNGKIQFKADRNLNYDIFFSEGGTSSIKAGDRTITMQEYEQSRVTRGFGIDHKNRIWNLTFKEQLKDDFDRDTFHNYLEFEIFDSNGILLYKLPAFKESFDTIKIIGDKMYFIDPYGNACVREYEIVDS